MELNCVFTQPLNASSTAPESGDFWQYSEMSCDLPFLSSFTDGTTTAYMFNVITPFAVVIFVFLIFFLVFSVIKTLWNFFLR